MSDAHDSSIWSRARIEALSDAVFAIAMTLMVLELKVPELPRDAGTRELLDELGALAPRFFVYFLTFAWSGLFWVWHHRAFHELKRIDAPLFGINLIFLSFVSLLPFSLGIIAAFSFRNPVAIACYLANLFALGLTLNVFWFYAQRRGFRGPAADPARIRRYTIMLAGQPVAGAIALATLAFYPPMAVNMFAIVMALFAVVARKQAAAIRLRAAAAPASSAP
jgi:TMEM175 potassium channel family protein